MNICTQWRELKEKNGLNLSAALDLINKKFKRNYDHSRYSKWERGANSPTADILDLMIQDVLTDRLKEFDLSRTDIQKIKDMVKIK